MNSNTYNKTDVAAVLQEILNMKTYTHYVSVSLSFPSDYPPNELPPHELIRALEDKIKEIKTGTLNNVTSHFEVFDSEENND